MKLEIDSLRQKENSVDCILVCTQMVLGYFNKPKTLAEIKKSVKMYKIGSYIPQLGIYIQTQGFKTEIVTLHPQLFTKQDETMTQLEVHQRLGQRKQAFEKTPKYTALIHFVNYLKSGGKVTPKIPNFTVIEQAIAAGNPIICSYTSNFLVGKEPKFNYHSAVITGIDEKYIYVNDPLWDYRGGEQRYLREDFLYALYGCLSPDADNGCLMIVSKR